MDLEEDSCGLFLGTILARLDRRGPDAWPRFEAHTTQIQTWSVMVIPTCLVHLVFLSAVTGDSFAGKKAAGA
jgi:hypothetical protein